MELVLSTAYSPINLSLIYHNSDPWTFDQGRLSIAMSQLLFEMAQSAETSTIILEELIKQQTRPPRHEIELDIDSAKFNKPSDEKMNKSNELLVPEILEVESPHNNIQINELELPAPQQRLQQNSHFKLESGWAIGSGKWIPQMMLVFFKRRHLVRTAY